MFKTLFKQIHVTNYYLILLSSLLSYLQKRKVTWWIVPPEYLAQIDELLRPAVLGGVLITLYLAALLMVRIRYGPQFIFPGHG